MLAQEYLGLSPATPNLENTLPDARTVADRRFDNLTADGSYMPVTGSIFYTGKAAGKCCRDECVWVQLQQ